MRSVKGISGNFSLCLSYVFLLVLGLKLAPEPPPCLSSLALTFSLVAGLANEEEDDDEKKKRKGKRTRRRKNNK